MPDPDPFHANLQRGSLLLDQNRPAEALPFIQAAIAANPDAARGYAELARCWIAIPAQRTKAIGAINKAIGLAPTNSFYFGRKAWYQVCLMDFRGALKSSEQGLAINPVCSQSLNGLANAYTKLGQWKKAEAACHRILAQDPNDGPGLNLLAQALRHQGRYKESREVVTRLLAQMPDNAFGHANAGYAALAAGDHLRANEHFRESLRMEPHSDLARRGLLQSLRARVWTTRLNLKLAYLIRRPANFRNVVLFMLSICAVVLVGCLIGDELNKIRPDLGATVFGIVIVSVVGYVLLSAMVGAMMNVALLFDSIGRHALTKGEKSKMFFSILRLALVILIGSCGLGIILLPVALLIVLSSIYFPLLKDRWQRRREKQTAG
jgi:tetratricopeptide (TPR) repeat protein